MIKVNSDTKKTIILEYINNLCIYINSVNWIWLKDTYSNNFINIPNKESADYFINLTYCLLVLLIILVLTFLIVYYYFLKIIENRHLGTIINIRRCRSLSVKIDSSMILTFGKCLPNQMYLFYYYFQNVCYYSFYTYV